MHNSCMCEHYIILFTYLKSSPHQVACDWSQFANQRLIPQPPQQKHGVLTTSHHGSPKKETSILNFFTSKGSQKQHPWLSILPSADYTSNLSLQFPSWKTQILSVYILWYSSPNHFIIFAFLQSYSSSCLPTRRCLSKAKRSHDFVQW